MVQDRPAGHALIVFHPIHNPDAASAKPSAVASADGSFQLGTYERGDGAPAGEYRITVRWPGEVAGPMPDLDLAPDRLRGRYANPHTSELRVRVEEKENVFTFHLR